MGNLMIAIIIFSMILFGLDLFEIIPKRFSSEMIWDTLKGLPLKKKIESGELPKYAVPELLENKLVKKITRPEDWYDLNTGKKLTDYRLFKERHEFFVFDPDSKELTFDDDPRYAYHYEDGSYHTGIPYLREMTHTKEITTYGRPEKIYRETGVFLGHQVQMKDHPAEEHRTKRQVGIDNLLQGFTRIELYNPHTDEVIEDIKKMDFLYLYLLHNSDKIMNSYYEKVLAEEQKLENKKNTIRGKVREQAVDNITEFLDLQPSAEELSEQFIKDCMALDRERKQIQKQYDRDEYIADLIKKFQA